MHFTKRHYEKNKNMPFSFFYDHKIACFLKRALNYYSVEHQSLFSNQ